MLTHIFHLPKVNFLSILGLQLAMACEPKRGSIAAYWDKDLQPGTIYSGASFGERFGMSRHRFENITQCLSLEDPQPAIRVDEVGSQVIRNLHIVAILGGIKCS